MLSKLKNEAPRNEVRVADSKSLDYTVSMTITWHGLYTVKIATQDTTLVLDPHPKLQNYPAIRGKASIVALSNPSSSEMSYLDGFQENPLIINTPGEYSVAGLTLYATPWQATDGSERNLQRWHIENMTLVHLGALDRPLSETELQELEQTDIDIALVPLGGAKSPLLKHTESLLTTLEPRIVIPIDYDSPTTFAKLMGVNPRSAQPKFNISRRKLPEEGLETVILSA